MEDVKIVKDSLRIIESKYVSSKKIDENSYKITFTYKNRNYSLDINKKYKFMMLTTTPSIHGMELNDDTLELIEYIKHMVSYLEFEEYNLFTFSLRKDIIDNSLYNVLETIKQNDTFDAIISSEILKEIMDENESRIIEYNFGLNTFDERLFDKELFEDFNEKVTTLSEEDLYLIYITLVSYFYKFINNMWEGVKIDPYIIDDMILLIYDEIQNRLNNISYQDWFTEWSIHFTEENIEKYLNDKNKEKNKELK